jgi:tRNA A37 threonylcarbamoyladenosine dehydratase
MKIVLSYHAKKRLNERGIKMRDVQNTIEMPEYSISRGTKKEAYKKIENKTLKVVYAEEDKYIKVITSVWK